MRLQHIPYDPLVLGQHVAALAVAQPAHYFSVAYEVRRENGAEGQQDGRVLRQRAGRHSASRPRELRLGAAVFLETFLDILAELCHVGLSGPSGVL